MPYPAYQRRQASHRAAIQQIVENERYPEFSEDRGAGPGYDDNPADLPEDEEYDDEYHRNIGRVRELGYSSVMQEFHAHQMMSQPE